MHIYEKSFLLKGLIILKDIRTDLAFESRNFYMKKNSLQTLPGIESYTTKNEIYTVNHVRIKTKEASQKIGKPTGNYITIHSEHIKTGLYTEELSLIIAEELKKLIPKDKQNPLILAAGLGNIAVTPDSIGPKVISSLIVTRHLPPSSAEDLCLSPLCALAPGVLGLTGIETAEIFSCLTEKIKPDCIIAIDALASRNSAHVGCTIQLSDTGINPGSGVNNRRAALNETTLKVPVIVVGVPTVSDASAVLYDALSDILIATDSDLSDYESEKIIDEYLSSNSENMMVTPKNIDALIHRASLVLSRGINLAVHSELDYSSVSDYIS